MIAVMIAAAMCVVPLFVIEDADAAEIKTATKALTFEGDMSAADFSRLVSDGAKDQYLNYVGYGLNHSNTTFSDINVKAAVTEDVGSNEGKMGDAVVINCKISSERTLSSATALFTKTGGLEDLYKYFGKNVVDSGTLKVEGSIVLNSSMKTDTTYYKTEEGKIATESSSMITCMKLVVDLTVTYNDGSTTKSFEVKGTSIMNTVYKMNANYIVDDKAKVIAATKVLVNQVGSMIAPEMNTESSMNYKFDGKEASYESKSADIDSGTFIETTAEALLSSEDAEVESISYYDESGLALFSDPDTIGDATLKNNANMETFLKNVGSVGDSFSTGSSIVDSAYSEIAPEGSSGGSNNNIIFYVIIGVLAVAVVALAVLLIKKK